MSIFQLPVLKLLEVLAHYVNTVFLSHSVCLPLLLSDRLCENDDWWRRSCSTTGLTSYLTSAVCLVFVASALFVHLFELKCICFSCWRYGIAAKYSRLQF